MRLRRRRPARCASTTRSCSNCTLKSPLGNFSSTVPVTSMLSSLLIPPQNNIWQFNRRTGRASVRLQPAPGTTSRRSHLHHGNVRSLQTLGSAGYFELDGSSLIQRTIAVRLNRGEMDEHILACFALDESIALSRVKPLRCTFFSHSLPLRKFQADTVSDGFPTPTNTNGVAAVLTAQPR